MAPVLRPVGVLMAVAFLSAADASRMRKTEMTLSGRQEASLEELYVQWQPYLSKAFCGGGTGDTRQSDCAEDACKSCAGPGATLEFNGTLTTCVYHSMPPGSGSRGDHCGEMFKNVNNAPKADLEIAKDECSCCRGKSAFLLFDQGMADGIGFTQCRVPAMSSKKRRPSRNKKAKGALGRAAVDEGVPASAATPSLQDFDSV